MSAVPQSRSNEKVQENINRDFIEGATSYFCQGFSVHQRSGTVDVCTSEIDHGRFSQGRRAMHVNDCEAARFPARAKIAEREIGTRDRTGALPDEVTKLT